MTYNPARRSCFLMELRSIMRCSMRFAAVARDTCGRLSVYIPTRSPDCDRKPPTRCYAQPRDLFIYE